jgi:RHS repeat-associated protein
MILKGLSTFICIAICLNAFSQNTITLNTDISASGGDRKASQTIFVQNGFKFNTNQGKDLHCFIDPVVNYTTGNTTSDVTPGNIDVNKPFGTVGGALNVANGSAMYNVPISLPPGINGLVPSVSVGYMGGETKSILGAGWGLAASSSITIGGKNWFHDGVVENPKYDGKDPYYFDGQRLILETGVHGINGATYNFENLQHIKITAHGSELTPQYFTVEQADGSVYYYGYNSNSRVDLGNQRRVNWQLTKVIDKNGNKIEFLYKEPIVLSAGGGVERLISKILYGATRTSAPTCEVKFNYVKSDFNRSKYFFNSSFDNPFLLESIELYSDFLFAGKYNFTFFKKGQLDRLNDINFCNKDGECYNPTKFLYDDVQNRTNETFTSLGSNEIIVGSGDYNGDGTTDVLTMDPTNFDNNTSLFKARQKGNSVIGTFYLNNIVYKNSNTPNNHSFTPGKFISSDIDGNGSDDIVNFDIEAEVTEINGQTNINYRLKKIEVYCFMKDLNQFVKRGQTYNLGVLIDINDFFHFGDFTGDSRSEIMIFSKGPNDIYGNPTSVVTLYKLNVANQFQQLEFSPSARSPFVSYPNAIDALVTDVDGDGKNEITILYPTTTEVYEVVWDETFNNPQNAIPLLTFNLVAYYADDNINYYGYAADLNGNGRQEIIKINSIYDDNYSPLDHKVLIYNDFNSFSEKNLNLNIFPFLFDHVHTGHPSLAYYSYQASFKSTLIFTDYNGDGMSDLMFTTVDQTRVYLSTGDLNSGVLEFRGGNSWSIFNNFNVKFSLGAFYSDGNIDLLYRDGDNLIHHPLDQAFSTNSNFTSPQKLKKVLNGLGSVSTINYSESNSPNFIGTKIINKQLPILEYKIPNVFVLSTINEDAYGDIIDHNLFSYISPLIHRHKGFLGFAEIQNTDNVQGITTKQKSQLLALSPKVGNQVLIPGEVNVKKGTTDLSTTVTQFQVEQYNDYKYRLFDKSQVSTDHIKQVNTEITNHYSFGYLFRKTVKVGSMEVETFYQYTNPRNWLYDTDILSVRTTSIRLGQSPIVRTEVFEYDGFGNLKRNIKNSSSTKPVINSILVNSVGNIVQTKTEGTNVESSKTDLYYDPSQRFVVRKVSNDYLETRSEIDRISGKPLKIVDDRGVETYYEYDGFFKIKNQTDEFGRMTIFNTSFELNSQNKSILKSFVSSNHKPDVFSWKNSRGQSVNSQMFSLNGNLTKNTVFDNKGLILSDEQAHFVGGVVTSSNYTYDGLNRVISVSNGPSHAQYSYSLDSDNNYNVTSTRLSWTSGPQSNTKVISQDGVTLKSIDSGGEITYEYNSENQLTKTFLNGQMINEVKYDDVGNQIYLFDANAGISTYEYDGYGRLTKQTDAKGNVTTLAYDEHSRISSELNVNPTTNESLQVDYTYFNSGPEINQISSVICSNGIAEYFQYDHLGRPIEIIKILNGTPFTKQFSYSGPDLSQITYPSGFKVDLNYDAEGQLISSQNQSEVFFENPVWNSKGQLTKEERGNGITSYYDFDDYGFPTAKVASGIQDYQTIFNTSTGNLISRTDNTVNQIESFTYDNLDRLKQNEIYNYQTPTTTQGRSLNYSLNGNIMEMSDMGKLTYDVQKINAVSGVEDINNKISNDDQTITYGINDRPTVLEEGNVLLEYTYGTSEREISEKFENNILVQTKYYLGDYIEIHDHTLNTIQKVHYIPTAGEPVVKIIDQNNNNQTFYLYTDHLGTPTKVSDDQGNLVYQQSFDAWGNNRNVNDWNVYQASNKPEWLGGFTGHEMLKDFGLINMNARLYDPLLGRFLSVDNYVQDPGNTQSYNRYSYVWNNPLKYTDPSGEFLVAPFIIGMAIGGISGGITALKMGYTFKDWQMYAGIGGGMIAGGVSGFFGGQIAASGIAFSNTTSIIVSSSFYSGLSFIPRLGQGGFTVSAGAASYNSESGFGYIGKSTNSATENIGYVFGGLANVQDLFALNMGGDVDYNSAKNPVGHGSITNEAGTVDISKGYESGNLFWGGKGAKWGTAPKSKLFPQLKIRNVNERLMKWMTKNIADDKGIWGQSELSYGLLGNTCTSQCAQALWSAGVWGTNPFTMSPHSLYLQLAIRQAGIYTSPYMIQIPNQ